MVYTRLSIPYHSTSMVSQVLPYFPHSAPEKAASASDSAKPKHPTADGKKSTWHQA